MSRFGLFLLLAAFGGVGGLAEAPVAPLRRRREDDAAELERMRQRRIAADAAMQRAIAAQGEAQAKAEAKRARRREAALRRSGVAP